MLFLIVGLGSIGRRHYRNLSAFGYTDIAVVRSKPQMDSEQKAFFKEFHPKVFYDLGEALQEKPDAVFITNPTSVHLTAARQAVTAGAHVFIEKPISHTSAGVASFLANAQRKRRVVYVGYHFRHHPQLKTIKRLIQKNALGSVFHARFTTGEYLPGWHPWEDYRKGYAARRDLGGGVLLTQSHDIDTALWLFGNPTRVEGVARRSGHLATSADDTADLILHYRQALTVSIHLDYLATPPVKRLEIYGTQGNVRWNYHTATLDIGQGKRMRSTQLKNFERNAMYVEELREFIRCITTKREPESDGVAGARVLAITSLIATR